jgi:GAF domain-containing protein
MAQEPSGFHADSSYGWHVEHRQEEGGMSFILPNENERLRAVRRYDILDTPPDGAFDRITALAARLFRVPIAIISIVDEDRIWFKSRYGVDVAEIPRDPGLCASAILGDRPWVVEDAAVDPRTLANPLVAGEFGLRFYAAVPLRTSDGFNLGVLCVLDRQPRTTGDAELGILFDLAGIVMDELELRLATRRAAATLEAERRALVAELGRGTQDALATARALAASSGDEADPRRAALERHLATLAEALDLVTAPGGEGGGSLRAAVELSLRRAGVEVGRTALVGPEVRLRPTAVLTLPFVLGELAAGAIRDAGGPEPGGPAAVGWEIDAARRNLLLEWRERAGAGAGTAPRRGPTPLALHDAVHRRLGGDMRLDQGPSGPRTVIVLPLWPNVAGAPAPGGGEPPAW